LETDSNVQIVSYIATLKTERLLNVHCLREVVWLAGVSFDVLQE